MSALFSGLIRLRIIWDVQGCRNEYRHHFWLFNSFSHVFERVWYQIFRIIVAKLAEVTSLLQVDGLEA